MGGESVHGLVEHLFRHQAGRLVASLVRSFGSSHLQLAEEVVQEAMMAALKRWPYAGVPDQPAAWLHQVARNRALDRLRRDGRFRGREDAIRARLDLHTPPAESALSGEISDDQLRLIFLCCHPDLSADGRAALTLKLVGGFSVDEIARAFFAQRSTVAQRLVRAQKRIRDRGLELELPPPDQLPTRLDAVLEAIYLIFNEGYAAHRGDELVRRDLCAEALRLVEHLVTVESMASPAVRALAALLNFQGSRLNARVDAAGVLAPLELQDRSTWDGAMIRRGFAHLESAAAGDELSAYHLQAGIASHHALAPTDEATDWARILELYDLLRAVAPSPVVDLNRAVAAGRVHGPYAALAALDAIDDPKLADYYLLHAARADALRRLGEKEASASALRRALAAAPTGPERRVLEKRLEELASEGASPQPS
ncbi:MAG: sigma-70 family RNA polymerase sigma factor [Acidobacteriota bacterium]